MSTAYDCRKEFTNLSLSPTNSHQQPSVTHLLHQGNMRERMREAQNINMGKMKRKHAARPTLGLRRLKMSQREKSSNHLIFRDVTAENWEATRRNVPTVSESLLCSEAASARPVISTFWMQCNKHCPVSKLWENVWARAQSKRICAGISNAPMQDRTVHK